MKFSVLFLLHLFLYAQTSAAECWKLASTHFQIEKRLLVAIAQVESGMKVSATRLNSNGSKDYGLMQINSMHLSWLKKEGIDETMLTTDPCLSILVGAYILQGMFEKYGYGWEAVGAYNAGLSRKKYALRMSYAKKVWQSYRSEAVPTAGAPVKEQHRKLRFLQPRKGKVRAKSDP